MSTHARFSLALIALVAAATAIALLLPVWAVPPAVILAMVGGTWVLDRTIVRSIDNDEQEEPTGR